MTEEFAIVSAFRVENDHMENLRLHHALRTICDALQLKHQVVVGVYEGEIELAVYIPAVAKAHWFDKIMALGVLFNQDAVLISRLNVGVTHNPRIWEFDTTRIGMLHEFTEEPDGNYFRFLHNWDGLYYQFK